MSLIVLKMTKGTWNWDSYSSRQNCLKTRHIMSSSLLFLFFLFLSSLNPHEGNDCPQSSSWSFFYTTWESLGFCSMPWPLLSTWLLTYGQTIRLHSIAVSSFHPFSSIRVIPFYCLVILFCGMKWKEGNVWLLFMSMELKRISSCNSGGFLIDPLYRQTLLTKSSLCTTKNERRLTSRDDSSNKIREIKWKPLLYGWWMMGRWCSRIFRTLDPSLRTHKQTVPFVNNIQNNVIQIQ